jgi:hypothetical protein
MDHGDVLGPDQTREEPRGELHHALIALELFDPHQREVTGIASPQPQRPDGIQPLSGRSGMVQQLAEWHVLINRSHDIHTTVEL